MFKFIYKLKAKFYDAPFFIKEHWQQFYAVQKNPRFSKDRKYDVLMFDNYAVEGDIINVLREGSKIHKYIITRISYVNSSYISYSNKQFDLQYHSTFYENKN